MVEDEDTVSTTPDLANLFDIQYNKGMGFKNEKYLREKKEWKIYILVIHSPDEALLMFYTRVFNIMKKFFNTCESVEID